MSVSSDVFSVRNTGSVANTVVFAGRCRLRQVEVQTTGDGGSSIIFRDGSGGTILLQLDFAVSDTHSVNIPGNGIVFPSGCYITTLECVATTSFLS